MTPYEKAQQILDEVKALADSRFLILPGPEMNHYAQVGNNVIACAGVTVTYTGSNVDPLTPANAENIAAFQSMQCGPGQLGIFNIVIARDCANIANQDGTDDPVKVAALSALMDADGQLLWDFAVAYDAWISKDWSTGHAIDGALGISTLLLTTGVD